MALTYAKPGEVGSIAPDFALPGVDGKVYRLKDWNGVRVLVIAFMCNHCPYVIAVQNRMNRLAQKVIAQGGAWVGINSNDASRYPDDSFDAMKVRAKEQGFVFPYLCDATQEVAHSYDAVCTPDFFVYKNEGEGKFVLQYKGRLDDHWKDEKAVTREELSQAIDQVFAGQQPDSNQHPSMGCSIKWKV